VDLLWTDIETTGLDERGGLLLELGLILTRGDRFEVVAEFSAVAGYPDIRSRIREPYVLAMHEASGLLDEVEDAHRNLAELEAEAIAWMHAHGATGLPMAGSSPHFDRRWLREHAPTLADHYHHRLVDATTLRILFGFDKPATNHRALVDLRNAIGIARALAPVIDSRTRTRLLAVG